MNFCIFAPYFSGIHKLKGLNHCFRRFLNTKGFGVQSPLAYMFLFDVIKQKYPYYDYVSLSEKRNQKVSENTEVADRLLFRISNNVQPSTMLVPEKWGVSTDYISAGCKHGKVITYTEETLFHVLEQQKTLELVCFNHLLPLMDFKRELFPKTGDTTVFVIKKIHHDMSLWKTLLQEEKISMSFDLYYWGIVFFNAKLTVGRYLIKPLK